ncbi:MAG: hypothetical protein JWM10_3310 [Myxococcaceae bacterium]|nr:hypothetical protein [Myxococcaceae bacterium]
MGPLPTNLLLVPVVGGALAAARYCDGPGRPGFFAVGGPRPARWTEALGALVAAVVSYLWLVATNPTPDLSTGAFASLIDCLVFGRCATIGVSSSVLLFNGAVWPDVLMATWDLGGTSSAAVFRVVFAALSAGVGLVFVTAWRYTRPSAAAPAALLALALVVSHLRGSPLLDTSFTFLFSAAAAAALLHFALSGGSWVALVCGALFVSHACNTHVSAVVLLPALIALPALAGRPPLVAVVAAAACWFAASEVTSAQALRTNHTVLEQAHLLAPLAAAVAGLLVAALLLHRRYQALGPPARAAVAAAALILPYGLGVLVLVGIKHAVRAEYLPTVIAPLSVAATALLAWPLRRSLGPRPGYWAGFVAPMLLALGILLRDPWQPR